MDDTFAELWPEDDDTIGGAYIHAQEFSDEDCEYYDPDHFYKKVQEEPASSALVDFAKVLQNSFDKNVAASAETGQCQWQEAWTTAEKYSLVDT